MKVEHVAFNVEDPLAVARWWVRHLGFKVTYKGKAPVNCRFITDESGKIAFELYHSHKDGKPGKVPAYARTAASQMHIAFLTENMDKDVKRLVKAGATYDKASKAIKTPELEMTLLRDPFGLPIQLIKRAKSVLF